MKEPITHEEIKMLDDKIKYCLIENPDQLDNEDDEYYVKIFFNYRFRGGKNY
jgi:hypothetical protein